MPLYLIRGEQRPFFHYYLYRRSCGDMEVIMNVYIDGLVDALHGCRFHNFCIDNNVKLALLFGSVAQGRARPDSDIDLALLQTSLLDLVMLNQATPFLRHQIARTCEVLYEKSPGDFADYASLALRQHNDARLFYELEAAYLAKFHTQSDSRKKLEAGE
jgi:predicted nucleotidyltransferase